MRKVVAGIAVIGALLLTACSTVETENANKTMKVDGENVPVYYVEKNGGFVPVLWDACTDWQINRLDEATPTTPAQRAEYADRGTQGVVFQIKNDPETWLHCTDAWEIPEL